MTDPKKRTRVLDAALQAFARFGFKRTTMGDIATQAGMSRPALYLVFCIKKEIFRAVATRFFDQAFSEIRGRIAELDALPEQLTEIFEIWTVRGFELTHQSPDGGELIDTSHIVGAELVEQAYGQFEQLLATILEDHIKRAPSPKLSSKRLARLLTSSSRGMKESAKDVNELRSMIADLISMTLATLGPAFGVPTHVGSRSR